MCGEISEVRLERARLYLSPRLRSDVADKLLGEASGFDLGTWLPSGFPYCHLALTFGGSRKSLLHERSNQRVGANKEPRSDVFR